MEISTLCWIQKIFHIARISKWRSLITSVSVTHTTYNLERKKEKKKRKKRKRKKELNIAKGTLFPSKKKKKKKIIPIRPNIKMEISYNIGQCNPYHLQF
jgi:hypothetical protein